MHNVVINHGIRLLTALGFLDKAFSSMLCGKLKYIDTLGKEMDEMISVKRDWEDLELFE